MALGGHLAAIGDRYEQTAIERLFLQGASSRLPFWIGLNDAARENTFVWSNGDRLGFQKWEKDEPNNSSRGEDYVVLNWEHARDVRSPIGTWNDTPDVGTRGFGGLTDGPYSGIIETRLDSSAMFRPDQGPPHHPDAPPIAGVHSPDGGGDLI